jgi:hypothetical protein
LLGSGSAHLIADRAVPGDGQADRTSGARVDVGELLRSGQAYLVADLRVARDGREGFGGGAGLVFG